MKTRSQVGNIHIGVIPDGSRRRAVKTKLKIMIARFDQEAMMRVPIELSFSPQNHDLDDNDLKAYG